MRTRIGQAVVVPWWKRASRNAIPPKPGMKVKIRCTDAGPGWKRAHRAEVTDPEEEKKTSLELLLTFR